MGAGQARIDARPPADPARRARRLPPQVLAWPLAVAAAVFVLVINEASYDRSSQTLHGLAQRSAASDHTERVLRRLLDAETGQRGYLLTGRRVYLEPYAEAAQDVFATLDALAAFHADDAVALARVQALRRHARNRLAELAQAVRLYDAGETAQLNALLGGSRWIETDQVRALAAQLQQAQDERIAAERAEVLATLRTSRLGVNASAALGLLALLMVLRQTAALAAIRRRHAQALFDEQERLEREVARRTDDLTQLARHLHTVRDDECRRLAHDLNDELGALLTATKLDLLRLRRDLAGAGPEVVARLDHLAQSIDSGITLKRRIIDDLRPSSLANLGLVAALEIQAREFADRAALRVHTDLQPVRLGEAAQLTVYRLVQEALTNVAKYAQARTVAVALREEGAQVRVEVRDDGRGFDPARTRRGGHGLLGMRSRVEAVGGTLTVRTAPGRGTTIDAALPLQADAAAS